LLAALAATAAGPSGSAIGKLWFERSLVGMEVGPSGVPRTPTFTPRASRATRADVKRESRIANSNLSDNAAAKYAICSVLFAIALVFVYRSFFGMRIPEEK